MIPIEKIVGRLGNQMFQWAFIYAQFKDGAIPSPYVQGEKYFQKYAEEIKRIYGRGIGQIDCVAVHVRRGDYVNNRHYVDLFSDGYYERALREYVNWKFLLFSDDELWCSSQKMFDGMPFGARDEVEALNQMASCMGHIIANSSFSWWGAYLSPHGGKVVAPKKWFSDGVERVELPNSWIRV